MGMVTWKHITVCILSPNYQYDAIVLIIVQTHNSKQIFPQKPQAG